MMKQRIVVYFTLMALCFSGCSIFIKPAGDIRLPALFSDNMVFQRDFPISIWGTAEPRKRIKIVLENQKRQIIVPKDGHWLVRFSSLEVGGPYNLTVIGKDTLKFQNLLVGDVWIASGQSNMEFPVSNARNSEEDIANAHFPKLRLLTVEKASNIVPQNDIVSSGWQVCSPKTVGSFSAVAFYFGRDFYPKLNIPLGIIHTSWGGTVAEAWTSGASLKKLSDFTAQVEQLEVSAKSRPDVQKNYDEALAGWDKMLEAKIATMLKDVSSWEAESIDVSDWKTMDLPILWEQAQVGLDNFDGIVWFRKEFSIPPQWVGKDLTLTLGPIDDLDLTYFNGTPVGHEEVYNKVRVYKIPGQIVKAGRNVIAVQVTDTGGGGGIYGTRNQLVLENDAGQSIPLAGKWHFRVGPNFQDLPPRPQSPDSPNLPTVLYNAMIHPLIQFPISGAIWYQGESNAARAFQYQTLFPALIRDWRTSWKVGDFPFYFVQLANYQPTKPEPSEDAWAELREAQLMTLSVPNTGMAVTIDIGDAGDIHPRNKQEVGRRLALIARAKLLEENIEYSGPIYNFMEVIDNKIRISFSHTGSGLVTRNNEELKGFEIAGQDRKFYWANAQIDNNSVTVWNPRVPVPVAVRYAWQSNPICNLYNPAGLPASPFRTDAWPGITVGVKQ
jgi:sialate O-acetylesterase